MYTYLLNELKNHSSKKGPIKICIAGTGFMGSGMLAQIIHFNNNTFFPSVITYRNKERFKIFFEKYGKKLRYEFCESPEDVIRVQGEGKVVAVDNINLIFSAKLDVVTDLTGDAHYGAELAYKSIKAGVHICASPEMDITIGNYLNKLADQKGVIYSGFSGDEPGELQNLISYVQLMDFEITAAGKFKKFLDKYANPESVKPWAEKFNQSPIKLSSFADGTKMNIEMAITANATGLVPDIPGMHCDEGTLETVVDLMKPKEEGGILNETGVIEIIRGVEPSGGVFVVGKNENPKSIHDLKYLKMGNGPYYLFYKAYHLCAFEMLIGVAKICVFKSSVIKPLPEESVCVAIYAKKDLKKGEKLDEIGGFTFYGISEKKKYLKDKNYVPVSAAPGCTLKRAINKDQLITIEDIEYNSDTYLWKLINKEIR